MNKRQQRTIDFLDDQLGRAPDVARFLEDFRAEFEKRVQESVTFDSTRRDVLAAFDKASVVALNRELIRVRGFAV